MWCSLRYAWMTIRHKWFVAVACFRVGGIPFWRILAHDLSKFTPAELPHYGRQFFGDKGDPDGFNRAWLHHQNSNPHHWEYWIPRTIHNRAAGGEIAPMRMPETYVREMIADWMGASRAYTGNWTLKPWYDTARHKQRLHPETAGRVAELLREVYGEDV